MSARRTQLAAEASSFRDPETDEPMLVAVKVHQRVLADLFYLSRVRLVGQRQAGVETCAVYGHEPIGRHCGRCGAPMH